MLLVTAASWSLSIVRVKSSLACLDCSDFVRLAGLSSESRRAGSGVATPPELDLPRLPPLPVTLGLARVGFVLGLEIVTLIFLGLAAPPAGAAAAAAAAGASS